MKTKAGFVATCTELKIFGHGRSIYEALDVFERNLELSAVMKDDSDVYLEVIFDEC